MAFPFPPFQRYLPRQNISISCITKHDTLSFSERDALFKVVFHKKD